MNTTKATIVDQADLYWKGWSDADMATKSGIRWKLLIAGERTESVGLCTGIAEVPPGAQLLLHHHEPEEIYYIVRGRSEMEIAGRTTAVRPGCAVYIPPKARHALRCTGPDPLIFVFTFPRDRFDQIIYHFDQ